MDKYKENLLALTKNLKLSDEKAVEALNKKILITSQDTDAGKFVQYSLLEMLSKTYESVSLETTFSTNYDVEVVVGNENPRALTSQKVFITWNQDSFSISIEAPLHQSSELHPVLLLLGCAYTCGAVIKQSIGSKNLGLGESYPILLKFKEYFGADLNFLNALVDLGELNLAGLGATGSWCRDALALCNVTGRLKGYDKDYVSDGNLQRSRYYPNQVGKNKALASQENFKPKNQSFIFSPINENIQGDKLTDGKLIRKLLCCVGTKNARRQIQDNCLPFDIFDCSTTDLSEVVLFFGKLGAETPCLTCIYQEDRTETGQLLDIASSLGVSLEDVKKGQIDHEAAVKISKHIENVSIESLIDLEYDSLAKQLCGQGKLPAANPEDLVKDYIAPLCHVSAIAGIFLAIEVVRRHFLKDFQGDWNLWKISPWRSPIKKLAKQAAADSLCPFHNTGLRSALEVWDDELKEPKENLKIPKDEAL